MVGPIALLYVSPPLTNSPLHPQSASQFPRKLSRLPFIEPIASESEDAKLTPSPTLVQAQNSSLDFSQQQPRIEPQKGFNQPMPRLPTNTVNISPMIHPQINIFLSQGFLLFCSFSVASMTGVLELFPRCACSILESLVKTFPKGRKLFCVLCCREAYDKVLQESLTTQSGH